MHLLPSAPWNDVTLSKNAHAAQAYMVGNMFIHDKKKSLNKLDCHNYLCSSQLIVNNGTKKFIQLTIKLAKQKSFNVWMYCHQGHTQNTGNSLYETHCLWTVFTSSLGIYHTPQLWASPVWRKPSLKSLVWETFVTVVGHDGEPRLLSLNSD